MCHPAVRAILLCVLLPTSLLAVDIDGEVRLGPRKGLPKPATVQLVLERIVVHEQFTGLDGRFEFRGVGPNRYLVRARYEDLPEVEVAVDVVSGTARYKVPITIPPPKVEDSSKPDAMSVDQLTLPKAAKREYEAGLKDRKAGNCDKAMFHLQKAIALAPKYGEAHNELGICLLKQNKVSEAETAFRTAIDLKATIYPSMNLADLYAKQKRFDDALQVLQKSLAGNPTEGDLFFAIARIYFDQGDMRKAEFAGLEAHSRIHRTADVHLLLAKIYVSTNNYPALTTQLETYLIENPTGPIPDEIRKSLAKRPQ
jgi:tetratricopeptide (TPR) repeat protein